MSYIDDNLMTGETLIYRAKRHWIIFLWPTIWLLLAFILGSADPDLFGGFLFLSILTGVISYMDYTGSEFGVTNKRILVKLGFIRRKSFEILLTKVEGIGVDQGILGRFLDYGTINITGTGGSNTGTGSSHDPCKKISAPFELRKKVQEQIAG
jgi:uncharacterized membrane protein YdbT with pleckstrin-like domain